METSLNQEEATWRDYALLHFYVVVVGFTAIIGHYIQLPASSLVTWRTTLSGLAIFAWLGWKKRRSSSVKIPNYKLRNMVLTGVVLGLHWLCFYGSLKLANVSITLTGMATTSLFTACLEPLITKRPFKRSELGIGLLIILGLGLVISFAHDYWLGLIVAVLAAILAAVFPCYNKRYVQQGYPALTITAYEMVGATIVCGIVMLATGSRFTPSLSDWFWLILLAGVCTVYAFALSVHLLKRMTAYTTSLALNFEPVYGILLAAWLLNDDENFDPRFYLGVVVIVAANFLHTRIVAASRRKLIAR